ncbi:MAG: DUF6671 family protein [Chloroflexota bacterium]
MDQIDTDRFGSFTGEIARIATQQATAIRKAHAAMEISGCNLGLASEGSFTPHPELPLLTHNVELVVLVDGQNNWVLEGWASSLETPAVQRRVYSMGEAHAFAEQVGFPAQGLVARYATNDTRHMVKGINNAGQLTDVVNTMLVAQGGAGIVLETDLRAHMNPKRMTVIRAAAVALAQNALRICPVCAAPGVRPVETVPGLPCEWCEAPTALPLAAVYGCVRCDYRNTLYYPDGQRAAPPGRCPYCNP